MSNTKKNFQLGMPYGTANAKLKKSILFQLLREANKNVCFQCGKTIDLIEGLSIEHKIPFLDSENPVDLFFDLNNIAFSHLSCNSAASRKDRPVKHPSIYAYRNGCKCEDCCFLNTEQRRQQRAKK